MHALISFDYEIQIPRLINSFRVNCRHCATEYLGTNFFSGNARKIFATDLAADFFASASRNFLFLPQK